MASTINSTDSEIELADSRWESLGYKCSSRSSRAQNQQKKKQMHVSPGTEPWQHETQPELHHRNAQSKLLNSIYLASSASRVGRETHTRQTANCQYVRMHPHPGANRFKSQSRVKAVAIFCICCLSAVCW